MAPPPGLSDMPLSMPWSNRSPANSSHVTNGLPNNIDASSTEDPAELKRRIAELERARPIEQELWQAQFKQDMKDAHLRAEEVRLSIKKEHLDEQKARVDEHAAVHKKLADA
ncbi:hypothetical protein BU26DRAFT_561831 [Trematosphaeria pertusa]|uniref:Clathrin light chain n=1 Tax=Trematosphaeria pertusa TaxID=390896 RepID=A0A6A6INA8_9PLEO|nr:uncharacterized protein BU26DRAFT_561831 [Trematosphaeria pertusa]KAF2252054.1 hypothetical protein BU26DRAFT_561831 [Trematosphaeria pertusa]